MDWENKEEVINEHEGLVYYVYTKEFMKGDSNLANKKLNALGLQKEDIIQEGLMGLYQASMSYDESKNIEFSTYAYHIIKYAMLDAQRKNQSVKFSGEATISDIIESKKSIHSFSQKVRIGDSKKDLETFIKNKPGDEPISEDAILLRSALNKINDRARQIVLLASKGYTFVELSKVFKITPTRVGVIYRNSLDKLRRNMDSEMNI